MDLIGELEKDLIGGAKDGCVWWSYEKVSLLGGREG